MNRTEMRSLFRSLIDDNGSNNIFTDSRINEFLYEGAQEVQDLLESLDEKLFLQVDVISIPADQVIIALPENTRQVIELRRTDSEPSVVFKTLDLRQLSTHERDYGEDNSNNPSYAVRNMEIVYPSPVGVNHTVELTTTQHVQNLEDDDSSWSEIPPQARRLVVYEAAYIGLVSEDSDGRQMMGLLERMRLRVIQNLDGRVNTGQSSVNYIPE